MFVLIVSELAILYAPHPAFKILSIGCVILIPVLAYRSLRLREAYLIAVCAILVIVSFLTQAQAMQWVEDGLSRAAFLASFILLMALLREGALTSPSVVKLGQFLTLQPPKRRFLAVFTGSHALSVMINLGSLSLLAPIIQRGVRAGRDPDAPLDEVGQIRERRQLTAALRGFSWFLVWAPTAVTQAVMPTLMSGIDALRLMLLGLLLALLMTVLSWTEDWLRWRKIGQRIRAGGLLGDVQPQQFPARAAANFSLVCAGLFVCSILAAQIWDVSIVTGVMLSAPIIVTVWVFVQQPSSHRMRSTINRIDEIGISAMPGYVREVVFIACAGFIGTVGAQLVPVDDIAMAIGLQSMPGWIVLWTLSMSVWLLGQVGLSPITMAIFLASIIAQINNLPADVTHAALAIATGTAICTAGAPFSSGAVMLARATGYSSFTLTWRWNGTYTLCAMVVLAVFYWILEGL